MPSMVAHPLGGGGGGAYPFTLIAADVYRIDAIRVRIDNRITVEARAMAARFTPLEDGAVIGGLDVSIRRRSAIGTPGLQ